MFIRYNDTNKYYEKDTSVAQDGSGPWLILPVDYRQIFNAPWGTGSGVTPHHTTHEPGGSDPLNVDAVPAIGSLRTLGSGANQAAPGNRLPLAHAPTHNTGGSDPITALAGGIITTGTIADARLSGNVALKNINNNFVAQILAEGTVIQGPNLQFLLKSTASPANAGLWRLITYGDSLLRLESMPDDMSAITSSIYFSRTGDFYSANIQASSGYYERGKSARLGEWGAYTPTWNSASNPQPTNGSIFGRYTLIGKTCHFQVVIFFPSGTTFGASTWSFGYPVPATASTVAGTIIGSVMLYNGSDLRVGTMVHNTSSSCVILSEGADDYANPTTPFTWVAGGGMRFSGTYEIS